MKLSIAFAAGALLASACFAASDYTPFGVKPGLWETKMTNDVSGPPPIPPEAMARMTPEQRERVEANMRQYAGQNHTTTTKACITQEQLSKPLTFGAREDSHCKYELTKSTASQQDVKLTCADAAGRGGKMEGTMHFEAMGPDDMKGNSTIVMTPSKGNPTTLHGTFAAHRLGSDCGDVKPSGR